MNDKKAILRYMNIMLPNRYDPYLQDDRVYDRLMEEYRKHGALVVAVDFDNTVFDYHENDFDFPALMELISDCKKIGFKIVVFSGSAKERHPFIKEYFANSGIEIDGINEDVIDWHNDKTLDWSNSKIYYNIFLDDRAGLQSAYRVLRRLVDQITLEKFNEEA